MRAYFIRAAVLMRAHFIRAAVLMRAHFIRAEVAMSMVQVWAFMRPFARNPVRFWNVRTADSDALV